jgi:hypothetical protein
MLEKFLVEFAKEYGLKEGIILSGLCEEMDKTDNEEFVFTLDGLGKRYRYLTEKQIRTGLSNLLNRKGIKLCENVERDFSRTLYYTINERVMVRYLKIMNSWRIKMNKKATAGS